MNKQLKIAITTMPSEEDGKIFAEKLVTSRIVECAKVCPITSFYIWEQKIVRDHESLLVLVVRGDKVQDLENYIRENHPYSIPQLCVLNCEHVLQSYLDWAYSDKTDISTS